MRQLVAEPPPEQGRPMGQDGPLVLFGVAAAGGGGAGGIGKRGGGGGGGAAGGGVVAVVAAAGDEGGAEAQGQQRLAQLPDYLVFLAFVRQVWQEGFHVGDGSARASSAQRHACRLPCLEPPHSPAMPAGR